jgi:hypothetical protein
VHPDPCRYEFHRRFDWRHPNSPLAVCGICHPPPDGMEIVQRDPTVTISRCGDVLKKLEANRSRYLR